MAEFAVGQFVELYATIPSPTGGSISSGTRCIVDDIRGERCLVALLASERRTGEQIWVRQIELFPA